MAQPMNHENQGCESTESLAPVDKSLFRRIEFRLPRKPFTVLNKGGGDGSFRLETLNPTSTSSNNTNGYQQSVWLLPEISFGITLRRTGEGTKATSIHKRTRKK